MNLFRPGECMFPDFAALWCFAGTVPGNAMVYGAAGGFVGMNGVSCEHGTGAIAAAGPR